jgi:hypothetical protein
LRQPWIIFAGFEPFPVSGISSILAWSGMSS